MVISCRNLYSVVDHVCGRLSVEWFESWQCSVWDDDGSEFKLQLVTCDSIPREACDFALCVYIYYRLEVVLLIMFMYTYVFYNQVYRSHI